MSKQDKSKQLVARFAEKYGVDGGKLFQTLKATAFKPKGYNLAPATDAQMMGLLIVADQYGLNPFTREIYAFPGPGGEITPVVSVDGWSRILNENPQLNGVEFVYSDQTITMPGAKPCPEWIEVTIHRKDRSHPTKVREYLDETYQPQRSTFAGPWQTHTKRMLRHKALIQGARVAFGFAGIYEADEAERIRDMGEVSRPAVQPAAQHQFASDEDVIDAQIIYPELSDEEKGQMKELLARLVARAEAAGAWGAAREYAEGRFKEGALQYALEVIGQAEAKAGVGETDDAAKVEAETAETAETVETAETGAA